MEEPLANFLPRPYPIHSYIPLNLWCFMMLYDEIHAGYVHPQMTAGAQGAEAKRYIRPATLMTQWWPTAEVLRPKIVISCYGVLLPVRYKTAERVTT